MKTSTKVTIGLSVAAIAGIATAAVVSEIVISKVHSMSNRRKVKRFVDDKFNGNETLLGFVDNLEDKDIDSFMKVAKKVNNGRDQIVEYGHNVKDATENVKDKITNFVDSKF
jgi:lipopolysaccharide export LptBFGC system permease protein LptF